MIEDVIVAEEAWKMYCAARGIKDMCANRGRLEKADIGYNWYPGESINEEERDRYLRLKDKFCMWVLHFCTNNWDDFQMYGDASGYVPCDLVGRQCNIACEYFGENCLRKREELKCPIEGVGNKEEDLFPYFEM